MAHLTQTSFVKYDDDDKTVCRKQNKQDIILEAFEMKVFT